VITPKLLLRRYVVPRRHSVLLGAIIATFGAPAFISYNRIATTGFSVALLLLLLLALYVVDIDDLIESGKLSKHEPKGTGSSAGRSPSPQSRAAWLSLCYRSQESTSSVQYGGWRSAPSSHGVNGAPC
jgi:hypothetical protein